MNYLPSLPPYSTTMSHDTTHDAESDTTNANEDTDEIDPSRRSAIKAIAYTGMCATAIPAASEVAQEATDDDEDDESESEPPEDFVPASVNPSPTVNCIEQSICLAVNEHRATEDEEPLAFNQDVAAVARYHSEYMADQGELSEASEYYDTHAARLEAADVECDDPAWILDDNGDVDPEVAGAVADAFVSEWIDDDDLHELLHTDSTNHGVGVAISDDGVIYVSYIACGEIESEMDMEQVEEQEQEAEDEEQDEEDAQEEQDEEQEQDDEDEQDDEQEQAVPEDTPTGVFADNVHGELTVTVEDEGGSPVEGYPVMLNGELYQTDENGQTVYQIGDGHDDVTPVDVTVDGETQTAEIDHGDNSDIELTFTVSTDDEGDAEMNMMDPEEAADDEDDEQEQEDEDEEQEDVGMPLSMDVTDDEAAIEDHIDSDTHIQGYRADEGVGEVEHRDDLAAVARWQSEYVAANDPNELQHEDDVFGTVADRLEAAGVECEGPGEVLAMVGFDGDTTDAAHTIAEGWLESDGHREIILGEQFGSYGVGVHVSDEGIAYATAVFCE